MEAVITVSPDGYVTGPDDREGQGLGVGGQRLHHRVTGGTRTYGTDHEPGADMTDADHRLLRRAARGDERPYASNASFRIRRNGTWLITGEFTEDRATLRVGNARTESFPLDGANTGTAMADRAMSALAQAGVTAPEQVSVEGWPATPAERLHVEHLVTARR